MSTFNTAFSRTLACFVKPSALLSIGILTAGALFAVDASAASFKCTSKLSASEKIVCQDPELSALDDRIAASWKRARDTTLDATALEAARTQQWIWRQRNCTDKACVKNWYDRRIVELDADYEQAKQARRDAFEASLVVQKLAPSAAEAVRKMKGASVANATTVSTQ